METLILEKGKLERLERIFSESTEEIKIPELNPVMGLPSFGEMRKKETKYNGLKDKDTKEAIELKTEIDGFKIVTVKVKQLDLPSYINIRKDINDYTRNLVDGISNAASISDDAVEKTTLQTLKEMPAEAQYRLWVVGKGVVEPQLSNTDLIRLSKLFPGVIINLFNAIIRLTEKGGTLKKNLNTT
jgi:hypothetical protein